MNEVIKAAYVKSSVQAPFFNSNQLIVFTLLLCFVKSTPNFSLSSDVVFTVVALINPLRLVCTLFVPYAIQFGSETIVTLNRIQVGTQNILMQPLRITWYIVLKYLIREKYDGHKHKYFMLGTF